VVVFSVRKVTLCAVDVFSGLTGGKGGECTSVRCVVRHRNAQLSKTTIKYQQQTREEEVGPRYIDQLHLVCPSSAVGHEFEGDVLGEGRGFCEGAIETRPRFQSPLMDCSSSPASPSLPLAFPLHCRSACFFFFFCSSSGCSLVFLPEQHLHLHVTSNSSSVLGAFSVFIKALLSSHKLLLRHVLTETHIHAAVFVGVSLCLNLYIHTFGT
jgi:hypothetical protein